MDFFAPGGEGLVEFLGLLGVDFGGLVGLLDGVLFAVGMLEVVEFLGGDDRGGGPLVEDGDEGLEA